MSYTCRICGLKFKRIDQFRLHLRDKHKIKLSQDFSRQINLKGDVID